MTKISYKTLAIWFLLNNLLILVFELLYQHFGMTWPLLLFGTFWILDIITCAYILLRKIYKKEKV